MGSFLVQSQFQTSMHSSTLFVTGAAQARCNPDATTVSLTCITTTQTCNLRHL